MATLEAITRGAAVKGILPDGLVTISDVRWIGTVAIEVTYKDSCGTARQRIALPRPRADPRNRRGGQALELRRRQCVVPAAFRSQPHPAGLPLRSAACRPHVARRAVAAPDHRRLQRDAFPPAAPVPAGGRSRGRQDDHDRPFHPRADRPWRSSAMPHRLPRQPGRAMAGRTRQQVPPAVRDHDQ